MKNLIRKAMQHVAAGWGYEMRREPSLIAFLHAREVDLVLDVGANEGQFANELRGNGFGGHIHSFEPIKHVFDYLSIQAARDPLWDVSQFAIGSSPGSATINISGGTVYSSLRTASTFGIERDANMRTVATETVKVATLDQLYENVNASAIFLKIDTQGFEREVLEGAKKLLSRCVGLQIELAIAHLYEGVWDFDEAVSYLKQLGFVPAQFRTVCTSPVYPESAVEVDCVFRRASLSA